VITPLTVYSRLLRWVIDPNSKSGCAGGMHQVTAELLAGTSGGMVGALAGHPFDTAKVRLQAMPSMQGASLTGCIGRTIREEGVLALYKGVLSPVGMAGFLNAIVFSVESSSARLLQNTDLPSAAVPFIGGCAGGFAQCPALCFMEAAKCNMQVKGGHLHAESYVAMLRRRVAELGLQRAFFPGFGITVVREVPSYGVYFLVYDTVKDTLDRTLPQMLSTLVAGGLAGVIALSPFHPFDVVKSRLQVSNDPKATGMSVLKEGIASEGVWFLSRGFSAFLLRTFFLNAATFIGFEEALKRLT